jgi:hypothetical protein
MRKTLFAICLLLAVPAFAQQPTSSDPYRITIFASNLSYTESDLSGRNFDGGIGAALEYRWRKEWSLELSVGVEERRRFSSGDSFDVQSYPVDLVALRHFDPDSNWKPYLGAGARYLHSTGFPGSGSDGTLSPQVVGGVHYFFTPRLSLRFDARQMLRDDSPNGERMFNASVGLGWRF